MAKQTKKKKQQQTRDEKALEVFHQGYHQVSKHPMFQPLNHHNYVRRDDRCPRDGWAVVTSNGHILFSLQYDATPAEWAYVIAHCFLHLGMGHFQEKDHAHEWKVPAIWWLHGF